MVLRVRIRSKTMLVKGGRRRCPRWQFGGRSRSFCRQSQVGGLRTWGNDGLRSHAVMTAATRIKQAGHFILETSIPSLVSFPATTTARQLMHDFGLLSAFQH